MGKCVIVYGKSGSGKSRSLKNFPRDKLFLINVLGKDMPFKNSEFKYAYQTVSYDKIKEGLLKMPTKSAAIDDAGYLMTSMFMAGHSAPKRGSSSFDLFNDIGDEMWKLLVFINTTLPKDVIVYMLMHDIQSDYNGEIKIRTIGKLLDEKVCIEGMTEICLYCKTDGKKHVFITQSDGNTLSKSPEDMFSQAEIENDLFEVDQKIRAFYNI